MKRIIVIFLILALSGCANFKTHYDTFKNKPNSKVLRIATYNVNWGEDRWKIHNRQSTLQAIQRLHADILLLQEITPRWQHEINQAIKHQYHYRYYRHYKNGGGLAVLSKYPVQHVKFIPPYEEWHPNWIFYIRTPLGKIQFMNVHLTPPIDANYGLGFLFSAVFKAPAKRLREIKYLYQQLNHHMLTILAGDFNESDQGSTLQFLRDNGFYDAILLHKKRPMTWHWPTFLLTLHQRYDRIFYTPPLHAVQVQVLHEGDSDHYPVVVDFTI